MTYDHGEFGNRTDFPVIAEAKMLQNLMNFEHRHLSLIMVSACHLHETHIAFMIITMQKDFVK